MDYLSINLKYLRKSAEPKVTQGKMAEILGVSPSTYGAYEEGRAEPKLDTLLKIAKHFAVNTEDLLTLELEKVKPIGSAGKGDGFNTRVLVATVDSDDNDNIEFVPQKAVAGYTTGYADPEFVQQLPTFHVPFLTPNRKYRVFPITGDSMLPFPDGALVFGEHIEDWSNIPHETLCIVVTLNDGVVFKKVYNYLQDRYCFLLSSLNEMYKPYMVPLEEIQEVWKFSGYFYDGMPEE